MIAASAPMSRCLVNARLAANLLPVFLPIVTAPFFWLHGIHRQRAHVPRKRTERLKIPRNSSVTVWE